MKTIIAGSRNFTNVYAFLSGMRKVYAMKGFEPITEFVSGGAMGADRLGEQIAKEIGMKPKMFEPNWTKYGKGAALIRNDDMARYADRLIVFWDGESKGTEHMISCMYSFPDKPVYIFMTEYVPRPDLCRDNVYFSFLKSCKTKAGK